LKAQMKRADELDSRYGIIVGEKELSAKTAVLRNMSEAQQEAIPFSMLIKMVIERIANAS